MSKELVISSNRHETKVAVLEEDQLVEVYFQRSNEYSLAGSIHKGRVTRVLPGMQSAFVDLGLERDTFLYVSDFLEEHEDLDDDGIERPTPEGRSTEGRPIEARSGEGRPSEGRSGDARREGRGDRGRGRNDRGRNDRGSNDRPGNRDANRGGFTDRGPRPQAEGQSAPVVEAGTVVIEAAEGTPPEGAVAESTAPVTSGLTSATSTATPAATGTADQRDRRGRRRRRRKGSRGFPDSKYGTPQAADAPDAAGEEAADDAEDDVPEATTHAPETHAEKHAAETHASGTLSETLSESAPIVLPGESLKKYSAGPVAAFLARSFGLSKSSEPDKPASSTAASSTPAAPAASSSIAATPTASSHTASSHAAGKAEAAADAIEDRIENPYDEPIHYPPENAVPDAPVHEVVKEDGGNEDEVSSAAHEHERAHETDHAEDEDEADDAPAVAPMLDEDEDLDIQAMILGEVEGIEIEPLDDEGAEVAEGTAEGTEAAALAESGSAEVRERGGRSPHRVSRRSRRRRGGDRGPERSAEAKASEAGTAEGADAAPAEAPHTDAARSDAALSGGTREGRSDGPRSDAQRSGGPRSDAPREGRTERHVSRPNSPAVSISDLLKEGQEIIVQIAKEPLGQKGARITSHIALPGRYVVYMPTLEHTGVSRKIASDEERHRLKKVLQSLRPGPVGGFITRTAAAGRTDEEIAGDMKFLYDLWQDIKTKSEKRPAPMLLHHDLDIVQRILRDQLADDFKAIWIDNEVAYEGVLRFVERFQPALVGKVKLYTREAPIFDAFNITNELEKALRPKVWLKSGGYIVINQTEALVAIDVNTGKFVGKSNRLEDTIVKTNTEAVKEIVRQIRLRDLGGIIVIDFIDMDERKNRQKVMQALEEAMRVDRAPYKILQFNDFGLVAVTRKRVKQSLERTLCSACPHCEGAGYIKSVQTVVSEILTEARKMAKSVDSKDVMLRVHPDVAKVLKSHQNKFLEELEEILRRPVLVKADAQLHHEKFDLA